MEKQCADATEALNEVVEVDECFAQTNQGYYRDPGSHSS